MKWLRMFLEARVFLLIMTVGLWSQAGITYYHRLTHMQRKPVDMAKKVRVQEKLRKALPQEAFDAVIKSMESGDVLEDNVISLNESVTDVAASLAEFGTLGCLFAFVPALRRRVWPASSGRSNPPAVAADEPSTRP